MPFKANRYRRHRIPKQRHRVTNWAAYDAGLRARGSLTVWFTPEAIEAWRAEPRTGRGGQPRYSSLAITTALTLRPTSAMPCRARPHGLATGVGIRLARSRGVRYLALEARHRRGAPFANGRATGERGSHRSRRAEPNAGAGTPGVRPHRTTRNTGRAQCAHTR